MKYRIGYRTLKTALGTTIAIMIAHQVGLGNYVSAGIITILCIQVTKRKSLMTSWERFLACLLAMPFSFIFFEGIAYHPVMIGIMLLFFIPTLVMLKLKDGVVTSCVIILHIFSAGQVTWGLLLHEVEVIVIGIGVALLMNLYMPSLDKKLEDYQQMIEANLRIIFQELVQYLQTGRSDWNGQEILATAKLIEEAKALSYRDVENRFLRNENLYFHYFKMRDKQLEIVERILQMITTIPLTVKQGKMTADFFAELSEHIHPGNTATYFLTKLKELRDEFQEMPLPKTREEFESRATLFQIVKEIEQYLIIKSSFKGLRKENSPNQMQVNEANYGK
ncbi:aromatic acid exporter family protein [Bacillus sp. CGMCC 1.16607]|uniref:aromatic acid exporter family protein n=1 Tax=Bacillus sp. CGMCC 1.16607 TaxID=3351842 RepID=UPI00362CAAF5